MQEEIQNTNTNETTHNGRHLTFYYYNNSYHFIPPYMYPKVPFEYNFDDYFTKKKHELCPDEKCVICLDVNELSQPNTDDKYISTCSHIFHKKCINTWLRINFSCPTCRKRPNKKIKIFPFETKFK